MGKPLPFPSLTQKQVTLRELLRPRRCQVISLVLWHRSFLWEPPPRLCRRRLQLAESPSSRADVRGAGRSPHSAPYTLEIKAFILMVQKRSDRHEQGGPTRREKRGKCSVAHRDTRRATLLSQKHLAQAHRLKRTSQKYPGAPAKTQTTIFSLPGFVLQSSERSLSSPRGKLIVKFCE